MDPMTQARQWKRQGEQWQKQGKEIQDAFNEGRGTDPATMMMMYTMMGSMGVKLPPVVGKGIGYSMAAKMLTESFCGGRSPQEAWEYYQEDKGKDELKGKANWLIDQISGLFGFGVKQSGKLASNITKALGSVAESQAGGDDRGFWGKLANMFNNAVDEAAVERTAEATKKRVQGVKYKTGAASDGDEKGKPGADGKTEKPDNRTDAEKRRDELAAKKKELETKLQNIEDEKAIKKLEGDLVAATKGLKGVDNLEDNVTEITTEGDGQTHAEKVKGQTQGQSTGKKKKGGK